MAGPIKIAILADASKATRELNKIAHSSSSMGSKVAKGAKIAAYGLASVTAAAGLFAYKVGSDYVDSLNKIQALTGKNDKVMKAAAQTLEANAGLYAKMGQTTGDAAAGVVELTKSGLKLHESLKAVNATMVLAKAGELSVADASTLVANSLNTFGLKAKDAGKIANQLANAANISSADVVDLAESFKYVSPVAAAAGLTMGEVNAVLAELSNSGIKASQAGTTFRTFLLNLQAPAKAGALTMEALGFNAFDASGKLKPLGDIIGQLGDKLNGLPAQEKAADLKAIFGKTGIAGAIAILKGGTDGLEKYKKGVDQAGAAQKLANARTKGLKGTLLQLKADAISTAQSLYRQYSPALNARIKKFVDQFKRGTGVGGEFRDALEHIRDIAVTLWPAMQKTAKYTGEFLGFLASHKTVLMLFAGGLVGLKALKVGKSVAGGIPGVSKVLGTTGVQNVFVTNWKMIGGVGGVVGAGGTAASVGKLATAGGAFAVAAVRFGGFVTRFGTLLAIPGLISANPNTGTHPVPGGSSPNFGTPFVIPPSGNLPTRLPNVPDIKAVGTAYESLSQQAANASHQVDLIGPRAQLSNGKAVKATTTLNQKMAAVSGAKASTAFDLIGHSASKNTATAQAKVLGLSGNIRDIPDRNVKITADTAKAHQSLSTIINDLLGIHDKDVNINIHRNPGIVAPPHARGGYITGPGSSTSDSILARLSNGEFVMSAAAVRRYGLDRLKKMNALRYSTGGLVGSGSSRSRDKATVINNVYISAPVGSDEYTIGESLRKYLDAYDTATES